MVLVRSAKALRRTVPAASLTRPASLFLGWCWSQAHLSPLPGVWPNTSQRLLLKPPLNGHRGLGNLSTRSTGKHGVCQIPVNSMSFYPFCAEEFVLSHRQECGRVSGLCLRPTVTTHHIPHTRVCALRIHTHTHTCTHEYTHTPYATHHTTLLYHTYHCQCYVKSSL